MPYLIIYITLIDPEFGTFVWKMCPVMVFTNYVSISGPEEAPRTADSRTRGTLWVKTKPFENP